jgi:hypothetical protein
MRPPSTDKSDNRLIYLSNKRESMAILNLQCYFIIGGRSDDRSFVTPLRCSPRFFASHGPKALLQSISESIGSLTLQFGASWTIAANLRNNLSTPGFNQLRRLSIIG